jgi:hypothetical protein
MRHEQKAPVTKSGGTSMGNEPTNVERIKIVKAEVTAGDKSSAVAKEHYKTAGEHLHHLKSAGAHKDLGMSWQDYIKQHCGISQERADELIRIYNGSTTAAKVRANATARKQKERAKKSVTSHSSARTPVKGATKAKKNELKEEQGDPAPEQPEEHCSSLQQLFWARQIGDGNMAAIKGTSLDSPAKMAALHDHLNRDRPAALELIRRAQAGEQVSAPENPVLDHRLGDLETPDEQGQPEVDVENWNDAFLDDASAMLRYVKGCKDLIEREDRGDTKLKINQEMADVARALRDAWGEVASSLNTAIIMEKASITPDTKGTLNRATGEPASDDLELPDCLRCDRLH